MANRFWVGGTGTWDASNTTNWSATSGGAGGASVPTASDYVTINSSSGGGTVTLGFNAPTQGLDIRTFTGTLAFSTYKITCAGNALTILRQDSTSTVTGTKLVELTYSGATGTRSIGALATADSNALNVSVTAGTDTVAGSTNDRYTDLNFTGFAGTYSNNTRTILGNLTVSSGMTLTAGTSVTTFAATSGTQQITTNGKTLDFPITQNNSGATLQLQDNLTMGSTRTFTLTAGTLDLVSRTLSTGLFTCSASTTTRSVAFGTGNITLTGNAATVLGWGNSNLTATGSKNIYATYAGATGTRTFSMNATGAVESNVPNILITAGTDTVASIARVRTLDFTGFKGTYTSGTAKSIFGGLLFDSGMTITGSTSSHGFAATTGPYVIKTAGLVMDFPITFANTAIGGIFEFNDAITMGAGRTLTVNAGTVKFKDGTTNTSGTFNFTGTSAPGRQINIQSTTPGTQYTLSQSSGTVTAQFMTIQDSNATGGATWNAYVDQSNIDAGNNDGWNFGISPVVGGAEYTYTIRSFTQPRRF